MMVVMPAAIQAIGMSNVLGGAWMGGTIDATGAVAAAGAMLGEDALQVAATIKMIQNILIGVVAFFVAVYWVLRVERQEDGPNRARWKSGIGSRNSFSASSQLRSRFRRCTQWLPMDRTL